MLAIFCPQQRHLPKVLAALSPVENQVTHQTWVGFEHSAPGAECCLAVVDWFTAGAFVFRLGALKSRLPYHPLVVATTRDADNVRLLKDVPVEELVWLGTLSDALWPAVRRAKEAGFRMRMARAIESSAHLDRLLRDVLVMACRADPPVHSVHDLAVLTGYDRRTLWRHWHESADPAPRLRLEDLLGWLLLLRALAGKTPAVTWSEVAAELGIHRHTLPRLAERLAGHSLGEAAALGQRELVRRFYTELLDPLLRRSEEDLG
jgi:hypothetical protein